MKKLLAVIALLFASHAFADSVGVEYGGVDINNGQAKQTAMGLSYRHDFTDMFAVDATLLGLRTDTMGGQTSDAATTRAELGGWIRYPLGPVSVYSRTAVANQSGSWAGVNQSFAYYSQEVGVTARQGQFDERVGYRYRNSFDTIGPVGFHTTALRLGAGYSLTASDRVGVSYDAAEGDYKSRQWGVNYTRSF